jgi:leader peptidase (prepilin peptidase)/N-methyltransferase
MNTIFFELVLFAVFGLLFGSFVAVMAYRIPREIPLGFKSHRRSFCPACRSPIPWTQNIPVISWFLLKGQCAQCHTPISFWRYPFVEMMTMLMFVLTWFVYRHSIEPPLDRLGFWGEGFKNIWFVASLIATVAIDIEFRIIPDRFSIGNALVALAASFLWGTPSFGSAVAGAALGFGAFFLLAWGYEKTKGIEGLGFGDVKMMAWLGAWVGFWAVPYVILGASVLGLVYGLAVMRQSNDGMKTAIPFGPFLALAGWSVWALQSLGIL